MKRYIILFTFLLTGLTRYDVKLKSHIFKTHQKRTVSSERVKLMTYNLENLFDAEDDPNKNDETYLPRIKKLSEEFKKTCKSLPNRFWVYDCLYKNWTEFKVNKKMKRLSKVILSYEPDILFVQEVENIKVLQRFNSNYLGFKHIIHIEGPDKRGIDTAILTNLSLDKKKPAKLHRISTQKKNKVFRGILEAQVLLPDKTPLTLYALHLPSQGHDLKYRRFILQQLTKISDSNSHMKIAAGDFNITKKEHELYSQSFRKRWEVSHLIKTLNKKGSYYYHPKKSWSFFDVFLFSTSFDQSSWTLNKDTLKVYNPLPIQNTKYKTPKRFSDGQSKTGVSDHWPLVAEIIYSN